MRLIFLAAVFISVLAAAPIDAVKSNYDDYDIKLADQIASKTFSVYTKSDSPIGGDRDPSIQFNVKIGLESDGKWVRKDNSAILGVGAKAVLFHSDMKELIGSEIDGTREYCCWKERECAYGTVPGQVMLDESFEATPLISVWPLDPLFAAIEPGTSEHYVSIKVNHTFAKSGVWRLWIILCGDSEEAAEDDENFGLEVNGDIHWLNPFGELPGAFVGYLFVYWWLFASYIVLAIVWGYLCHRFRQDLLPYQRLIMAVLVTGILENFVFGLDYVVYNITGEISVAFNVFSVLFSTIKRTIAFLALMLASRGWGITVAHSDLKRFDKTWITVLIILYAVFSGLYQFLSVLDGTPGTNDDIPRWIVDVFSVPDILVGFAVIIYIFVGVYRVMRKIGPNGDKVKLRFYFRFMTVLALSYIAGLILLIVYVIAAGTGGYDSMWRGWFLFDTFWSILHLLITFFFAVLLRPSKQNSRFAYSAIAVPDDTPTNSARASDSETREELVSDEIANSRSSSSSE